MISVEKYALWQWGWISGAKMFEMKSMFKLTLRIPLYEHMMLETTYSQHL